MDVWQTNAEGLYDLQARDATVMDMRGRFRADAEGRYHFRTVKPIGYSIPMDGPVGQLVHRQDRHGMRPAHIHILVAAEGYRELVTALYFGDDREHRQRHRVRRLELPGGGRGEGRAGLAAAGPAGHPLRLPPVAPRGGRNRRARRRRSVADHARRRLSGAQPKAPREETRHEQHHQAGSGPLRAGGGDRRRAARRRASSPPSRRARTRSASASRWRSRAGSPATAARPCSPTRSGPRR